MPAHNVRNAIGANSFGVEPVFGNVDRACGFVFSDFFAVAVVVVVTIAAFASVLVPGLEGDCNHGAGLMSRAADNVGLTVLPVSFPHTSFLSVMIAHQYVPMPFGIDVDSAAEI